MSMDNTALRQRRDTLISKWDILFEDISKEWIGFQPSLGDFVYPCYACRHMFSCLRSFQDHVNRRVILLKFKCAGCRNENITFYNRCSFLLHTREHYNLGQGMVNLSNVDVFTLPVSFAGFLPHPNIPLLYAAEEELLASQNIYINTQFYTPDNSEKGKQFVTLKPNNIVFKQHERLLALRQICKNIPKCEFITAERQAILREQSISMDENSNFNGTANGNLGTSEAVEVKEESPDQEEEPAPVITMPVISKVESLKEKRFRFPTCLECHMIQKGTMAEHYLGKNQPTDPSLRCVVCKFIASTACSLKAHMRIHGNLHPFVCPDCGKDFFTWNLLREHMDDVCFHLAKQVRYRCPGKRCGKLFALTATFASHFQLHLKVSFRCMVCLTTIYKIEDAEAHRKLHETCVMRKLYECPFCPDMVDLTEHNYREHVEMHTTDPNRCVYAYLCKHCRSYFRSTTTYATHLLKCSVKKLIHVRKYDVSRYLTRDCEKCTNKIIFNEQKPASLCNKCKQQSSNPTPVLTKRYFCILCNKQIQPHEKTYHRLQCKYGKALVVIPKLTTDDIENMSFSSGSSDFDLLSPIKSDISKRRRSSDSSKTDDSAKKKRKRTYIPVIKHRKEVEHDLTAEEPVQFDGTYRCKLCDYESANRVEFHTHIRGHRDISTAYQCMECAECFVVKPSLIKHLMHFHNITDHESYLKENDCFDVEAVKELESIMKLAPGETKEPVKENQCRVCRKEFEDALSLNKHFRIHGMAFLLRNSK